jgi:hypothetical protein
LKTILPISQQSPKILFLLNLHKNYSQGPKFSMIFPDEGQIATVFGFSSGSRIAFLYIWNVSPARVVEW